VGVVAKVLQSEAHQKLQENNRQQFDSAAEAENPWKLLKWQYLFLRVVVRGTNSEVGICSHIVVQFFAVTGIQNSKQDFKEMEAHTKNVAAFIELA